MSKIHLLKDASVLDVAQRKPRELSPLVVARREERERLRGLMRQLTKTSQAFEIVLDPGEKPFTVRARLLRAAEAEGKEIAVRKHGDGFAVGLMTPERRSNRGRRPAKTQDDHSGPQRKEATT